MNNLAKWLVENGFSFKTVEMNDGERGIMVNTDYEGYYPNQETLKQQSNILNKVKKIKGLKAESRGNKSAVLITVA